jgi:hypothetical protein
LSSRKNGFWVSFTLISTRLFSFVQYNDRKYLPSPSASPIQLQEAATHVACISNSEQTSFVDAPDVLVEVVPSALVEEETFAKHSPSPQSLVPKKRVDF